MGYRLSYVICTACLILLFANNALYAETTQDEKYLADFAYRNLVRALASLSSDEFSRLPDAAKSLVQDTPFLALKILEDNRTISARELLVKANALRLDAALGEEHTCATLRRGKSMLPAMKQLKETLKDANLSCEEDARRLDVNPASVCAETSAIARRVDMLLKALKKGEHCE